MADNNIRRMVGGVSAFAVAAGFAVVAGAGVAGAAPASVDWWDGSSHFTRTVSNTTPAEGDVITVSTKFERKEWTVLEILYGVKDVHAPCLTYVEGSAKVDGSPRGLDSQGADFAKVAGSWTVYPNIDPKSHTFEFSYKVGPDCARDTALQSGMHYSGSLGSGTYDNKGPAITVGKNASTTTLASVTGAQVGQAVTLSATVTGGANGDTVDFYDGGTKIGSGTLNNGVATYSWTPGNRGSHTLVAKFPATPKANASESGVQTVQITDADANSSTVLAPVGNAQVGRPSVLKATVSPAGAGGTVTFKDGAAVLAEVPVPANGEATYTWVPSTSGAHAISAAFSGRAGVTASTANATITVAEAAAGNVSSTTALAIGGNPTVGASNMLSAQVSPGNAGGSVTFKDGDTVIGTAQVDANGNAGLAWTPATAGQRVIKAEYSGAGNVNASADSESVQVMAAPGGGDGGNGSSLFGSS
ncbi:Ig-like domain-containing protein [Rhodococcus sp. Q]|uniref:Ig-like domain-containing protein n=1 Tax=Rhodococcus sp. Q TaxID=2502252 RepID=UPI0010F63AD8|nr:Ig-like domain-containing protein [Rhodococcus sp. Q]